MHLVQGTRMRIVFRSRVLDFTDNDNESIERARRYGIEVGVHSEQIPLEKLLKDPFCIIAGWCARRLQGVGRNLRHTACD